MFSKLLHYKYCSSRVNCGFLLKMDHKCRINFVAWKVGRVNPSKGSVDLHLFSRTGL